MHPIVAIVVMAVFAIIVWWMWNSRYESVVRVVQGRTRVARGKVPAWFLADIADAFARSNLNSARVRGVRKGHCVSLIFSRNVPPGVRQQLRNLWQMSR
jgi:hypothetical protein